MERYLEIKRTLEQKLLQINQNETSLFKQAKHSILECIQTMELLKNEVKTHSFKTKSDEIYFFKHLKPNISGLLIFYIQLFQIETRKPLGNEKQLRKYFNNHLKNINTFKENNISFYQYYRSESVYLDEKYFIRSKSNLHLILDHNDYNYDISFNTSHDRKVAQIIANDLLRDYIQNQLNKFEINLFTESLPQPNQPKVQLNWTDNKIKLIELIYALHAAKCINSGTVELSEIATAFEDLFGIELKDYYRKYIEIKGRKGQYTKFLDQLKQALENRINIELQ